MKKIFLVLTMAIFAGTFFSCEYELEKDNPNNIKEDTFIPNESDLIKLVNSTYAVLQAHQLFTREWFFVHDMRGDDMATGGGQLEVPRAQLLIGTHDAANYVVRETWKGYYGIVHRANYALERAPMTESISEDLRNRLIGEVKFLQAWAYFELVSMWGGVPIYTEFAKNIESSQPRATEAQVYEVIENNLEYAISVLPVIYKDANDKGRATQGAARSVLARALMQQGKYAEAKIQLQAIMDLEINGTKVYRLTDSYNDNFLEETEYNVESVFEVGYKDNNAATGWETQLGDGINMETTLRNQEYNAISWRNAVPSDALIADFEDEYYGDPKTDPRFKYCFYLIGDVYNNDQDTLKKESVRGNTSLYHGVDTLVSWRKHSLMYKTNSGYYPSGLNERTIRFAEIILMMAECQLETGEPSAAIASLNIIRNRPDVMMPNYPTVKYPCTTNDEIFKAIVHEKRIELCCECIRDRDIIRWRKFNKLSIIGGEPISYFESKHALLPIPQNEINNNPKITISDQNPGY